MQDGAPSPGGRDRNLAPASSSVFSLEKAAVFRPVPGLAVPGEYFTVAGQAVKRRSPHRCTYVCGVANDSIGYIPDRQAYALGGYPVWTGYHSNVAPGTAEAIVDEAVKMHPVGGVPPIGPFLRC